MSHLPCTIVRERGVSAVSTALLRAYYDEIGVQLQDGPGELEAILAQPGAGFWLARFAGEAAGCVLLRPLAEIPGAAECKRLYVRPAFRGRGVAGELLDAMEAFAREAGWQAIYLDSKDDLTAALALYQARGYTPCDRYNHNPQATTFFRKTLA